MRYLTKVRLGMRVSSVRLHYNAKNLRSDAVVSMLLSAECISANNANNSECVIVELRSSNWERRG
ncbi:hypothetical protein ACVWW4_000005 [Bradyrhizobium sp. LB7.1]